MANRNVILYNPTPAVITVNSQNVPAHGSAKLVIADTTTDLYAFLAAGCMATPTHAERAKYTEETEESGEFFYRGANDLADL
jgi:hypothetical protein